MKLHTNEFKQQSKLFGNRINAEIHYDSAIIDKKEINSLKFAFNTELFKTIMKQVAFDINEEIPQKTWVNPKFGYKVGSNYEMLDYGTYYINDKAEYSADNKAYTHIAYDSMIESMIPFDESPLEIEYPISYGDILRIIATKLGWTFTQTGFPNENTMVEYDLYSGSGLTYRDILDDLCPASMGNIMVTDNKEMQIIYATETDDVIDATYLNEDNVNIGKKIGPINALVLTRAEGGDSIYRRDEDDIVINELHEIKISDNLLLSSSFRENFVDEMFDKIKGFQYYEIDIKTVGLAYYDLLDRFTINLDGNSYSTVVLNCDLTLDGGVEEILYSPALEEVKTDYTVSGLTDKGQKFANIIAYKNQARIELVASEIKNITDFIKEVNNQGDLITLPNTPKSNGAIRELRIKNFQLLELYPGMTYPSGFVYPGALNFYMLIFDNVDTFDNNPHYVYINSPIPLQSLIFEGQTYHNELVIEENKIKIIENIKWNFETEEFEVVPIPTIHELGTTVLPTFEVDTYLKVDYFEDLIFEAEYLIKNDFTDTFATQAESSSQFTINSEEIATKVSKDNIISEINQSPEEIKISANKIILEGNEEFTSIISQINNEINQVKDQIDGKVSTWYGEDVPTLYNYPADGWVTEEDKNNHLGDLYYDDNGQAYRFSFQDNEYFWKPIVDSDIQAIYEELSTTITQTEDRINLEVAKKTNKTEIISTINQSAEAVAIDANKISLAGKTIDLTSDNIVIDSTNFKVTKAGVVTANSLKATNADLSGKITANSGSIGGWNIGARSLVNDNPNFAIHIISPTILSGGSDGDVIVVHNKTNSSWPFILRSDGSLIANKVSISGTITGSTIKGSTINGTNANFGNEYSGGYLRYYNGTGYMSCGAVTDHPWFSAVQLAATQVGGLIFRTGQTIGTIGSVISYIDSNTSGMLRVRGSGSVEINNGYGGNVAVKNIKFADNHIYDTSYSAHIYLNDRIVLSPNSLAYINSATTGNRIATSSSGPSSRNVKENLKELKYDGIYNDLQKLKTYFFDYKYDGIKDEKSDFGFIIDEIEEMPTISKFAKHYDVEGYIQDGKLIPKRDGDEEQESMTPFKYKEWDRDSYIKMLLLFIKSLQEKVDNLERVVTNGQAN